MVATWKLTMIGVLAFVLWRAWVVFERLYFSPISKFPGPRLAAASFLREIYFDLIAGGGGQFPDAVRRWHKTYGPIIRINPMELHVQDSSWFDTLYTNSRPAWKIDGFGYRFNNELSSGGTEDPSIFRLRRTALNPFFSRRRIAQEAPKFQVNMQKAMAKNDEEYVGTARVLKLNDLWGCFAADNLRGFCFRENPGYVTKPGFHAEANEGMESLLEYTHWFWHFPFAVEVLRWLPDFLVELLYPGFRPVLKLWNDLGINVATVLNDVSIAEKQDDTVFRSLMHQDLPPQEVTHDRYTRSRSH